MEAYTERITETVTDLLDNGGARLYEEIASVSPQTSSKGWEEKLAEIRSNNLSSARYVLIRFLQEHAEFAAEGVYTISLAGRRIEFPNYSSEAVQDLSEAESETLKDLLFLTAQSRWPLFRADGTHETEDRQLDLRTWIDCAWDRRWETDSDARSNALKLGHALRFSVQEMKAYLLRVFDFEDGLRLNHSEDLIDLYGFLLDLDPYHVEQLKTVCLEECGDVKKRDDTERNRNWTVRLGDDILQKAAEWKKLPAPDTAFRAWFRTKAPGLDLPSHRATRLYRNLAALAVNIGHQTESADGCDLAEEDLLDLVTELCRLDGENPEARQWLMTGDAIDEEACHRCALFLMRQNMQMTVPGNADSSKNWRTAHLQKDGTLRLRDGRLKDGSRVEKLLTGELEVEKADILFLVFTLFSLLWTASPAERADTRCVRLLDYMDASDTVLEAALLPKFYAPHAMEQITMLSIVSADGVENDPIMVYSSVCELLTSRRPNREKGSKKHGMEEKMEVLLFALTHPDLPDLEIGKKYAIGRSTIGTWKRSLAPKAEELHRAITEVGQSAEEIAAAFHLSAAFVEKWRSDLNPENA